MISADLLAIETLPEKCSWNRRQQAPDTIKFTTVFQRGNAGSEFLVQLIDEFIVARIQIDRRRFASAAGKFDPPGWSDDVGIGAQGEQIGGCFYGREAAARNDDSTSAFETFDGCAHGGLELEYRWRVFVAGIDSF